MTFNEQLRTLLSEPASEEQTRALSCESLSELLAQAIPDADVSLVHQALVQVRADEVRHQMQALVEQEGAWTAHDIKLATGVHTLNAGVEDTRLRRVLQVSADLAGKPLDQLRVLDLGCLEGQFAIEFALQGSQVVAIERREINLRKARFAAQALGISNLELRLGDVRELDEAEYGRFDIVLCLGILYHLDTPDVMNLVRSMAKVCRRLVIIDSHISLKPRVAVEWDGRRYWGDYWREYSQGSRADEEEQALWSSVGNDRSFLLTRASLCNLLRHEGFTSVYDCLNPYECHSPDWPLPSTAGECAEWPDRSTFIAVKGESARLPTSPLTDSTAERDRPERPKYLQPVRPSGDLRIAALRRVMSTTARRLLRRS